MDFFLHCQNFFFEILRKKKCKNITKNHLICVKHEEKTVKRLKCIQSSRFCAVRKNLLHEDMSNEQNIGQLRSGNKN